LQKECECWCVFGTGGFAFRFGPYTGPEAGKIMSEAVDRSFAKTSVMNCGPDMDWELAQDASLKLAPLPEKKEP
jgi:hypothetical protein